MKGILVIMPALVGVEAARFGSSVVRIHEEFWWQTLGFNKETVEIPPSGFQFVQEPIVAICPLMRQR